MRQPRKGPSVDQMFSNLADPRRLFGDRDPRISDLVTRAIEEGWNWETSRFHASPDIVSAEDLWLCIKIARRHNRIVVPLRAVRDQNFSYQVTSSIHRHLHEIDLNLGGTIQMPFAQLDSKDDQKRYLVSSLYEESIASSQIEGAVATREQARELLRTNREPRNESERMILNNYLTITRLNGLRNERLTIPLLKEIQSQLTERTSIAVDARGRFRSSAEKIAVWDDEENEPVHVPPPAEELDERMQALCEFANADAVEATPFIHPVVRSIILHFWLAYDHPFVDGNGRTARALFYWSMLKHGYWLTEYLAISTVIRNQPKQYARAFLDTEIDENDLTYFIHYHLRVVERSMQLFKEYFEKKRREKQRLFPVVLAASFNERQQALLSRAIAHPDTRFTYASHANSHQVTEITARGDLLALVRMGLLKKNAKGRRFEFVAAADLETRLNGLAGLRPET